MSDGFGGKRKFKLRLICISIQRANGYVESKSRGEWKESFGIFSAFLSLPLAAAKVNEVGLGRLDQLAFPWISCALDIRISSNLASLSMAYLMRNHSTFSPRWRLNFYF